VGVPCNTAHPGRYGIDYDGERRLPRSQFEREHVIVETNGLPDCAGNVTPVGDVATNYLRFGDGNNDFMMCQEENMRSCFVMARRAPTS
jgi:hypothetical protein